MRKWYYSGICRCGHDWEDHHLSMVVNPQAFDACVAMGQPAYVPGACLHYGFNECEGLDEEGNPHCFGYIDKENNKE